MLIDTHCHLNHSRLAEDLEGCIVRAHSQGVTRMIVVGFDIASSREAVALADRAESGIYAAVGIHPHDAKSWDQASERLLREWAENPRVVALGEIGLDFHHDFSPRERQFEVFRTQLALAREVGLPVIIHCREAYPETLEVLRSGGVDAFGGVMHCWAGSVEEAIATTELGMMLGFGGTLTFKNAEEVRASAVATSLDRLLVETDAPYLAPMPHRGQRNEPGYTRIVAERLADLRGIGFDEIAEVTTANTLRCFPRLADER